MKSLVRFIRKLLGDLGNDKALSQRGMWETLVDMAHDETIVRLLDGDGIMTDVLRTIDPERGPSGFNALGYGWRQASIDAEFMVGSTWPDVLDYSFNTQDVVFIQEMSNGRVIIILESFWKTPHGNEPELEGDII